MADEAEQTTIGADGESWVDGNAGNQTTGYNAQNTSSVAVRNGIDSIVVEEGVGTVDVKISGPIDENGILFNVKTAFSINVSGSTTTKYLVLKDGTSATLKTIATTEVEPVFVPAKNGFYTASNERVLNTAVVGEKLVQMMPFNKSSQSFINATWHYLEAARWRDVRYEVLRTAPSVSIDIPNPPGQIESTEILSDVGIYSSDTFVLLPGLIDITGDGFGTRNCIFVAYYGEPITNVSVVFTLSEQDVLGVSMYDGDLFVLYNRVIEAVDEIVVIKYVGLSDTVDSEVVLADSFTTGIDFDEAGNLFSCGRLSDLVTIYDGFSNIVTDTIDVPNPADICVVHGRMIVSSTFHFDYAVGTYSIMDIKTKMIISQYGRSLGDFSWGITVTKNTDVDVSNEGLDCIVTAYETGLSLRY